MIGCLIRRELFAKSRGLISNFVRHEGHGGVPGENLPFTIGTPARLNVMFILFFGSGLAAPYLVLGFQYWKKSN